MGYTIQQNIYHPILAVGRVGALCGNVHIVRPPAWITDNALVLDASPSNFDLSYLAAVLRIRNLNEIASKTAQPLVTGTQVRDQRMPCPPFQDQHIIASFLDRKTTEIDQLIASKEKLISLYEEEKSAIINHAVTRGLDPTVKTKPSGAEWLGDIPEHWEVKRLKRLSTIISKGTTPSTIGREILPVGDIRFIKAENVVNNTVVAEPDNFIDEKTNEIIGRSQLEESDILFVIAGATIGKVAILPAKFCPANTNQAISFIRLQDKNNVKFVWYWLQSDSISKVLWLDAVQSAQPNLSMENLGNFHVPFPLAIEQSAIVTHIETECSQLWIPS
jgi:type I restriction enzyme, S subunit